MKFVSILTVFIALTSFTKTKAQKQFEEGYVITAAQDTLRGFVNYLNWSKNPESIQFKTTPESQEQVLGLQDISGFFVHDELYVKAVVKVDDTPTKIEEMSYSREPQTHEQTVFLRALVTGPKGLFYLREKKDNYYIARDSFSYDLLVNYRYKIDHNGGENTITNDSFKGQLNDYLADCPAAAGKTRTLSYSSGSLIKLFNTYYSACLQTKASVKSKADPFTFRFGAVLGGSATKYSFGGAFAFWLRKPEFSVSYKPTIGVSVDIGLPRTRKRMSFYNDLLFVSAKMKSTVYNEVGFPQDTKSEITVGYDCIKLSTLFRYKLPIQSGGVFANLGISNGFRLGETNRLVRTSTFSSSEPTVTEGEALEEMRSYIQSRIVGVGGYYKKVSFEFRYSSDSGISFGGVTSKGKSGYFLLAYQF